MTSTERTTELVEIIQSNHEALRQRCSELGEPLPSSEKGMPAQLLTDELANTTRQAIINASEELQCLVRGPRQHLTYPPHTSTIGLHALVALELYRFIPVGEGRSYGEIASASQVEHSMVKRIFRHAMSRFIFCEEPKGIVRHNAFSQYLAESPEMRHYILVVEEEMRPASCQVVNAIKKWPDAQEPAHTGYQLAHRTDLSFFKFLSQDSYRMKRFGDAMTWFSTWEGMEVSHLVSAYPWADVGEGKVVDVGGSFGTASLAVADKFPALRFVVQDLPQVVAQSRQNIQHASLTFEAHDFFEPQPVQRADVYFLRQILHDWSDKYAAQILKNIVGSMSKTSRILIMEKVLPEYGAAPTCVEQEMRSFDLAMLEIQNGRERDLDDWKALLQRASPELVLKRHISPPGSQMDLIEAGLK